ncbi:MAG: WYL domain-containing protein [Vicinamibacterales bacterium]|nr:WYL domain-containing protein [Vicinamibacterales bacterium]
MPRNAEVIRQWKLLLALEPARYGKTVDELAEALGSHKRTIWRDLKALQEAGFPLTADRRDRKSIYRLTGLPLKALHEAGLSTSEACALYAGRALLLTLTGSPFERAMTSLVRKIERALPAATKAFLDQLPGVIKVKPAPRKSAPAGDYGEVVARIIEACADRRVVRMTYFSAGRNREKDYEIHPYHVAYHDGGLYLSAYVPEYHGLRTFALERILRFTPQRGTFTPTADLGDDAFGNSLGVNQGAAERIVIDFSPRVARYVHERTWHPTQSLVDRPGGGVRCTLKVCRDYALEHWILGWGPHARVVSPSALAEQILEQLSAARDGYVPRLDLEAVVAPARAARQPRLRL